MFNNRMIFYFDECLFSYQRLVQVTCTYGNCIINVWIFVDVAIRIVGTPGTALVIIVLRRRWADWCDRHYDGHTFVANVGATIRFVAIRAVRVAGWSLLSGRDNWSWIIPGHCLPRWSVLICTVCFYCSTRKASIRRQSSTEQQCSHI